VVHVLEFSTCRRERVAAARQALLRAGASGDDWAVQVRTADLEDVLRMAGEHGVSVGAGSAERGDA
jgi:putative heme degradation protein